MRGTRAKEIRRLVETIAPDGTLHPDRRKYTAWQHQYRPWIKIIRNTDHTARSIYQSLKKQYTRGGH